MTVLTSAEHELVALGAALASNCIPCVTYHIAAARKAGLSDPQIVEALAIADQVRQVPASAVLDAVGRTLPMSLNCAEQGASTPCCP